jgi:hypothetical protein
MHYEYGHTRNCWAQHSRTSYSRGTSRIDLVFLLKISNFSLKIHLWGSKWGSKGGKRLWKCTWSGTRIKNLERFYTSAWESNDICQGTEWFFDWFWIWKKFVNIDADCITQHNWLVRFQIWQIVSGLFGSCSCLIDFELESSFSTSMFSSLFTYYVFLRSMNQKACEETWKQTLIYAGKKVFSSHW